MELFGTYENPGGIVEKSPLTQTTSDMDKSFEAFLLTSQAADENFATNIYFVGNFAVSQKPTVARLYADMVQEILKPEECDHLLQTVPLLTSHRGNENSDYDFDLVYGDFPDSFPKSYIHTDPINETISPKLLSNPELQYVDNDDFGFGLIDNLNADATSFRGDQARNLPPTSNSNVAPKESGETSERSSKLVVSIEGRVQNDQESVFEWDVDFEQSSVGDDMIFVPETRGERYRSESVIFGDADLDVAEMFASYPNSNSQAKEVRRSCGMTTVVGSEHKQNNSIILEQDRTPMASTSSKKIPLQRTSQIAPKIVKQFSTSKPVSSTQSGCSQSDLLDDRIQKDLHIQRYNILEDSPTTYTVSSPQAVLSETDNSEDSDYKPCSSMKEIVPKPLKRRRLALSDGSSNDDMPRQSKKRTKTVSKPNPTTSPLPSSASAKSANSTWENNKFSPVLSPKPHPNAGKERNGPFTVEEHDAILVEVRTRREWEEANPQAQKLRDQPFWEYILRQLHQRRQCLNRLSFGSLKNYWNRVGRARSQYEERLNGGKNGSLVASVQKPKGTTRRRL